ncbi:MAG: DUF4368 domain-containing protein [Lawsonibacter sp.]|nr:DUF4368 domain-containing protein [Lawsonibacter sp.]
MSLHHNKDSQALKTLYLDKVAGILSEELTEQEHSEDRTGLMERAKELLKLETVPRELVVGLVERIEICEKNQVTGRQEVKVFWKF